jgi:uncharacterized membrane-anchored protein YjiN (DUF445 family)
MFKIDLDQKWIDEQLGHVKERVEQMVDNGLQHTAHGVIQDMLKQALKEELAKPFYKKRIQEIVKKMLLDRQADEIIRNALGRY